MENIQYLSDKLVFIIGIILNLILYFFCNKPRLSDFITGIVFILNTMILSVIYYIQSSILDNFSISLFNNLIRIDDKAIIYSIFINIFALLFIMVTNKINRKSRFREPLLNSIFITSAMIATLIFETSDFIMAYLLLELLVISIYKFASSERIKKVEIYNFDFLLISALSTILFFGFYITTFFMQDSSQLSIIQVCITSALFLKIGIFPIYNYLIYKKNKTNIPYCILQFCFLPCAGLNVFLKIAERMNLFDEIYQIPLVVVLLCSIISFSLIAFKTKNIVKYLACTSMCYNSYCFMNVLFMGDGEVSLKLSAYFMLIVFSIYSLICALKINFKINKINFSILKGAFVDNKFYSMLLSLLLLTLTFIIPSALVKSGFDVVYNIYSFDKAGIFVISVIVFANILILFNALKLIKNCYSIDKYNMEKLQKRTTLNYVVPLFIFLFLVVDLFL